MPRNPGDDVNVAEDDADDPDDEDVKLVVDMAGIENRCVCCKRRVKNGWRSYSPMEFATSNM